MKKVNLKIFIVLISVALYFLIYNVNNTYKNRFIQNELNSSQKELKTNYDIVLHTYTKSADSIYYQISKNEKIIQALSKSLKANKQEKDRLRKEVYIAIKEQYAASKSLGLKLILFADPNNNAFLRVHKPDKHGDNITKVRYAVQKVNNTREKFSGFEPGKITHAFRNIYPLYDKQNNYLGCVDIGFSSEYLQNTLHTVHKIHTHFLVAKNIVEKRLWEVKSISLNYKNSIEDSDYLASIRKDVAHKLKNISLETIKDNEKLIHKKMADSEAFSIYGDDKDSAIIISFHPIFSIEKNIRPSAYVVSYTTSDQIAHIMDNYNYINIISFIVILLVMLQVYQILSHRDALKHEVEEKTNELHKLNQSLETRIQEEVEKNRKNEIQLLEQSKNASLGEMIGNIAHQWRQPLSAITSTASSIRLNNELGILESEEINKNMDFIVTKAYYLSNTINTFRNFLKADKTIEHFILEENIKESLEIVSTAIKDHHIKIDEEYQLEANTKVTGVKSELSQVIINILNNSKDIIKEKNIENGYIKISSYQENNFAFITIEDNGGGVPESIMPKIFDPYFTTKHQSQGTGLGLHMSYRIITESLKGKLWAQNTANGAKFFIKLPLNI